MSRRANSHVKAARAIKLFLTAALLFGVIAAGLAQASEDTPLLKAVRTGTYPDVQRALTKESIHDRDQYGNTAIMIAASRGYNNTMRLLIKQGGDVHATNSSGVTALMIAASAGRVSQIITLVKHGADIEARDAKGKTALLYAAGAKDSAALDVLLTHGADPGATDNQGNTAMIYAASVNSVGSLYALAEYDQSYDKTNKRGQSPLFIAAANGSLDAVKALVEHGASVDHVSSAGETPLLIAVYKKYPEVVRALLAAGADRNLVSNAGHTPVSLTNTYGDAEMKSLFDKNVELEGNRVTTRTDSSGDAFKASAGEFVFTGDVLSLIGGAKPQPVISKDAPIFKAPPITKGAGFLLTAPGGLHQVFKGTLLAFEKDIAEVLVKNAIRDTDATVRCRVSVNTRGIDYAFENIDSRVEQLKQSYFTKEDTNYLAAISSDTVRKWINKPVSIAPAGEKCAHFELL